jgi:hypothetical protein
MFEDKSTEGAVIGLPNVMCLRVESGVWLRQSTFEPLSKSKLVSLDFELEALLLPVRLSKVKMEIGQLGHVRHKMLGDGDVTSGGRNGI